MEVGHTNPPVDGAFASHPGTTSENANLAAGRIDTDGSLENAVEAVASPIGTTSERLPVGAGPGLRTRPKDDRPKSRSGDFQQAFAQARLHLRALTRNVKDILRRADKGQAALTEEYIQAGRLLWDVKAACKLCGELFKDVLVRDFPGRKRATLREYMTLAKGI